ncbi:MAG: hypothetical protein COB33_001930 [Thiotrichaceae bacterium]|nr:hypothetical protein [Thiotrichaceae bacterium]
MKPVVRKVALLAGADTLFSPLAQAASCCGGGASSALVLPKFSTAMVDVSFDIEQYDGFWNNSGRHNPDPPGSDLSQSRLNVGYAHRLSCVWNDNQYSGLLTNSDGLGDTKFNLWYEAFDGITCVWKVKKPADLKPAPILVRR